MSLFKFPCFVAVLGLVASASAQAAGPYTLTDLGSMTRGNGMNADGDVAGMVDLESAEPRSAIWHAGTATWTVLRKGWTATAVNRHGGAVGSDSMRQGFDVAIRWSPAGVPTLLRPGTSVSEANDIDDAGTVYGDYYDTTDGLFHAVTWTGDVATELGCIAGYQCTAITGNGHGVVAGNVLEINGPLAWPALVQDGQWTILPTRGGCGRVHAVNARGHVVGDACQDSADNTWHGFLWKGGRLRDLGSTHRAWISSAFAVDAHDVVAGMVQQPGAIPSAAVWEAGTWTVLADVTAGADAWHFWNATGIDASGRVLVNASGADGHMHALVLTPVAAP